MLLKSFLLKKKQDVGFIDTEKFETVIEGGLYREMTHNPAVPDP